MFFCFSRGDDGWSRVVVVIIGKFGEVRIGVSGVRIREIYSVIVKNRGVIRVILIIILLKIN